MATKITSGSIFSAGAVVTGVDADAPPAVPSPSPEPAPEPIDVESYLGAPDFSLEDTAPDTFLATPWENTSNGYTGSGAFIAIDTTIDVNNSGVLFEIGGAQSGIGFAQDGNEFSYGVCKGNSTLHNMTTDVSSYNGQTGTFYLTGIRQSNGGTYPEIALYWQEGGSGSTNAPILLDNQSFPNAGHDFYWGSSAGGYGQVYESSRALPTLQNYSGTLTGLRIWKDYTTIELPSTSSSPAPEQESLNLVSGASFNLSSGGYYDSENKVEGTHSLYLDGSGDTQRKIVNPESPTTFNDYTISMWFRRLNDQYLYLFNVHDKFGASNSFGSSCTFLQPDNKIYHIVDRYNGSNYAMNTSTSINISNDTWYHYVVSYSVSSNIVGQWITSQGGSFGDILNKTEEASRQGIGLKTDLWYLHGSVGNFYDSGRASYDAIHILNVAADAQLAESLYNGDTPSSTKYRFLMNNNGDNS